MNTSQDIKAKKCAICSKNFTPYKSTDRVCSYACSNKHQDQKAEEKKKRDQDREKKAQEFDNVLTYWYNRYIRLRDRGKDCITCTTSLGWDVSKYDAGHRFSVGGYPELRYNELNTWGQCKKCNQGERGNYEVYDVTLPERIGQAEYNGLILLKNIPRKYSEYELKALILKYKKLCKTLEREI